ncbi:MAG: hypothetical protein Q7R81_04385 [Candidatus Peregrinibacteria bacterium]|nr:hypothetical protein [Candidatus Peregrinibacteria bacterium]
MPESPPPSPEDKLEKLPSNKRDVREEATKRVNNIAVKFDEMRQVVLKEAKNNPRFARTQLEMLKTQLRELGEQRARAEKGPHKPDIKALALGEYQLKSLVKELEDIVKAQGAASKKMSGKDFLPGVTPSYN